MRWDSSVHLMHPGETKGLLLKRKYFKINLTIV